MLRELGRLTHTKQGKASQPDIHIALSELRSEYQYPLCWLQNKNQRFQLTAYAEVSYEDEEITDHGQAPDEAMVSDWYLEWFVSPLYRSMYVIIQIGGGGGGGANWDI